MNLISTVDACYGIDIEHTAKKPANQAESALRHLPPDIEEAQMTLMATMMLIQLIGAVLLTVGAGFYCGTQAMGFMLSVAKFRKWLLGERKR